MSFLSRLLPTASLGLLAVGAAQAQDVYYSQAFANRQVQNPAWAGVLDDYSATLSFRNQFPQLAGSFVTTQVAGDVRLPQVGLHHALGLVVNQDYAGSVGYTRLEGSAQYAYHTRLTRTLALSGGASLGAGRQRVGYDNYTFGDQFAADGTPLGTSAENLSDVQPRSYFTVGVGGVLYAEQAWLSLSAQHLNRPDLGFRQQAVLPMQLAVSAGYKLFIQHPRGAGSRTAVREISFVPTATYTRQGGSQRSEAGLYFIGRPLTLGALYRNLTGPDGAGTQHVAVLVAGVETDDFRLGYSYDVGLSNLAYDLGGAHEITIAFRAFDKLESAYRRLKRRNYPLAPCPAF